MSKVFRLYREGTTTYRGWNENPAFPYNSNARDTIEDPDGASAKNEITSIPSPFARIDLVKTAFKEVCRRASHDIRELEGNTIFHKMVSDSLDVGEIFFNIDKFKDRIEIITWDPSVMIGNLKNDQNPSHYYVADALQKYLLSDAKTYNFNQLKNIYLLNYTKGNDELNIIGATSPATLFFSGANNLNYVDGIFFNDGDKPFDNNFQPLFKRDFAYIKAWWTLRKVIANFSSLFPEIEEYLNLTFKAITDQSKKSQLNAVTQATSADFSTIVAVANAQINQVEVLGHPLFMKKRAIVGTTDFTIKPERTISGTLPFVLPVEAGNKYAQLQYTNGVWGNSNKAPYEDQSQIGQRVLPFDGARHPYLTISDFLEDTIVKVPHTLNTKFFFNGNVDKDVFQTSYLLPIKPLYFKYFSIKTLDGNMNDGRKACQMDVLSGGSIRVILRIPIGGNGSITYMEYARTYYSNNQPKISPTHNEGGMTSFDFTGFVMPCKKFQTDKEAYYTIPCITPFSKQYRLEFYKCDGRISNIPSDCRYTIQDGFGSKAETYTLQGSNFDFIRVIYGNTCNALIPRFKAHQNINEFEFAVDLGTSNTHVEMKNANDVNSEAFSYDEHAPLFSSFFKTTFKVIESGEKLQLDFRDENSLLAADFIPSILGQNCDFQFPTRTVLSFAKTTDWKHELRPFGLVNFSLTYNKRRPLPYNDRPKVNIKWSSDANSQTALKAFIDNVMLLIRNKVIVSDGNLSNTKITWFFPNSMSPKRLSQLKEAWDESYGRWFNHNGFTSSLSESVAPIQFYFRRFSTATNLVNVDIGGGTADIAFSTNGKVEYVTSFKFAANSLFEDPFSQMNPNNGIVDFFKDDIKKLLQGLNNDLEGIFNNNIGQPSNMASFFFSLKGISKTKELNQNSIDFNKILQNDAKFKIVFILFYTAIIYHIAQVIKVKGLKVPRHIAFSGNGSKIVTVLSSSPEIISKYTKKVFENVLGKDYETPLDILGLDKTYNPKEVTCKGGLIQKESQGEPKLVVLKDSSGEIVGGDDTYKTLDEEAKINIINSVKKFFKAALEEIPQKIDLQKYFDIDKDSMNIAKEECTKDLETYLDRGIALSIEETGNVENQIEDSLSFYPIKGVLNSISNKIKEYFQKQP